MRDIPVPRSPDFYKFFSQSGNWDRDGIWKSGILGVSFEERFRVYTVRVNYRVGAKPRPGRVDIRGAGLSHRVGPRRRMDGGASGARAPIPTDVPTTEVSPQGVTRTFLGGQNAHFTGLVHILTGTKLRVHQRTLPASSCQRACSLSRGPTTTPSATYMLAIARERYTHTHTCVCILQL